MKHVKLDDKYFANVEDGVKARLDKASNRGMHPQQIQALTNFANKIRNTIEEHRDDNVSHTPTTPATPNSKKYEEDLARKVDLTRDHLSAIVSRVLKHRSETPKIVENVQIPKTQITPTNEPSKPTDNTQIDNIIQEIQDMLGNYTHTVSVAKEELPVLLQKAERILQTLQTLANINSPSSSPPPVSTTAPASAKPSTQYSKLTETSPSPATSSQSHPSTHSSTHATTSAAPSQTTTSQSQSNPSASSSSSASSNTNTQSLLKQPTKIEKDSDTPETVANGTTKSTKSPNTKRKSTTASTTTTTPTKTNGSSKRKSMSTKDDVANAAELTPRRSSRRKTQA